MNDLQVGWACDVGHKRRDRENQDAVGVFIPDHTRQHPPLFVVADGMGGYQGGEIASQIVIETFQEQIRTKTYLDHPQDDLEQILTLAHQKILDKGKDRSLSAMGCTMVAALLQDNQLSIINVGDARAYIITRKEIFQISQDHSWVSEQVRLGKLTPEEARSHPNRNRVSMSISAKRREISPNFVQYSIQLPDTLLLCSDGLWGMVPENLIKSVVNQLPPQRAAEKLVDLANANHGKDNISVIIVRQLPAINLNHQDLDDTLPGLDFRGSDQESSRNF